MNKMKLKMSVNDKDDKLAGFLAGNSIQEIKEKAKRLRLKVHGYAFRNSPRNSGGW